VHLALPVRDEARSRRFYETYFGFDAEHPERMSDGVLMLFDSAGFSLALKETEEPISLPDFFHFAFRSASDVDEVRTFRDRLRRDGVPIVGEWEEPDYVSVKCRDPDGFVVEFAWEPDEEG
jgi:catechol 2,3-dioxygenase-like lactoylglutathione lyase family enzyme